MGALFSFLTVPSRALFVYTQREQSSLVSLLTRTPILLEKGPTLMTSLNLNYFLKGFISRHRHTKGLAPTCDFWEDPITLILLKQG